MNFKASYFLLFTVLSFHSYKTNSVFASSIKGVPPSDAARYQSNKEGTFTCFDNSKTILFKEINDDYCDCLDGSDEPGTSACKNSRFYCLNEGFVPSFIPSSRVNDGICEPECCDGSDEYDGKISCPNLCSAKESQYRAAEAERLRLLHKGAKKKLALTKLGKEKYEAASKKLADLESELAYIQNIISLKKYQVENSEKAEKISENEEKLKGKLSTNTMAEQIRRLQDKIKQFREKLSILRDGAKSPDDIQAYLNQLDEIQTLELEEDLKPLPTIDAKDDGSPPTFLNRLKASWVLLWSGSTPKALDLARKETQAARDALDEAQQKETKLKDEKSETEKFINLETHNNHAFLTMADQCYSTNIDKYVYTICPFKKTIQNSDGNEVSLGFWNGKWIDDHSWLFTDGQHCWNGPVRSTKVFLECGPEPRLLEAKETSRCIYEMRFQNPASCEDLNSEPEIPQNKRDGDL